MKNVLLYSILSLLLCNCGDKRTTVSTTEAPASVGPYSQAVLIHDRLYVSGQIGWKADGTADTATIEGETQRVLENIKAVLQAGGKTMADVSKVTIYCTDLKNFAKINGVYSSYFSSAPPARETVQVCALPKNAHVEISAIAD